jgi:uncharacterized protein involved in propanediol utilization
MSVFVLPNEGRCGGSSHGTGIQCGHWGEIIQGPIRTADGEVAVGLVTLPRESISTVAKVEISGEGDTWFPGQRFRAFRAAKSLLERQGLGNCKLRLTLSSSIPFGVGAGSSSADIIASILATADAIGVELKSVEVQGLCWEIEGASDPLALISKSRTAIYGSRVGRVIDWIGKPLPAMMCLGFNASPGEQRMTDDIIAAECFCSRDVDEFDALLAMLRQGVLEQSIDLVGLAATKSATLRQRLFPLQRFESFSRACIDAGAAGVSISHSGVVAAALFSPQLADLEARLSFLDDELRKIGASDVSPFFVGSTMKADAGSLL